MTQVAFNYSPLLAELVRAGQVDVDCFKCPAWPALVAEASALRPAYIHFPLSVGAGQGCPVDEEAHAPADLGRVADLLAGSASPLVNAHLIFDAAAHAEVPHDSRDPRHMERLLSAALRDLQPLIERFGAERVLVENLTNNWGWRTIGVLPEFLHRLLEATGCGLLFDQPHARLAARALGLDEREYCAALPVERIREVHVTGLQVMPPALVTRALAAGDPGGQVARMADQVIDHLPMTAEDWSELDWLAAQLAGGQWASPWVIAAEIGGVGGFWELVMDRAAYLAHVPRLSALVGRAQRA